MPATEFVNPTTLSTTRVSLEPAHVLVNSLVLINKLEKMPGVHEWVERTSLALSPEQRHANLVVMEGLYNAVAPHRSWSSFETYLQYMEQEDPLVLRQRNFDMYEHICSTMEKRGTSLDIEAVLRTPGSYLDYLYERFPAEYVNVAIETDAYHLLQDPAQMQATIVGHLRQMWTLYLAEEWDRTRPLLQSSVDAFRQVDLSQMTPVEAAETVTGQDMQEWGAKMLSRFPSSQIILTPSPHLGPYLSNFKTENTIWLLFGARLPQGSQLNVPDLSRSELLVRVSALADDTRLRILQLIKEEGEMCSQDVQQQLDLSQSAGSRHLKQLSATGYLKERRIDGAKCYSLNDDRIDDTLQALSHFLKG